MKIDLEVVQKLAKNINKYNLSELTFEGEGEKIIIKKEVPVEQVITQVVSQSPAAQPFVHHVVDAVSEQASAEVAGAVEAKETINSPMVGTFYRTPAPGAAPFVIEGQEVKEGDVICIVEAMKLMNEVKATKNCKIVKVLVQEGTVLKKGDAIFAIE